MQIIVWIEERKGANSWYQLRESGEFEDGSLLTNGESDSCQGKLHSVGIDISHDSETVAPTATNRSIRQTILCFITIQFPLTWQEHDVR